MMMMIMICYIVKHFTYERNFTALYRMIKEECIIKMRTKIVISKGRDQTN